MRSSVGYSENKLRQGAEEVKIHVTDIKIENGDSIVYCRTPIGDFKGIWAGNDVPRIDEEYHIELSIGKLLNEIAISEVHEYLVSTNADQIDFIGLCEGADDEVLYIRFNIDWIEMIDIIDGVKIGDDFVTFSADYRQIKIYPYTI